MRKLASVAILFALSLSLSGCGLMEDAFKAGVIFAIILVAIVALIVWLARFVAKVASKKYDLTWDEDEITRENSV